MNVDFEFSSQFLIGALLLIGPIAFAFCLGIGVFGFSPDRAQAIRGAEADTPIVLEEIRRIHVRSPDKFRHDRLDRNPFYLAIHVAVWFYAWCIFGGAPITSNLASLTPQTKLTMATCFIIGSTLVLFGSLMGLRIGRWTLFKGIRDNVTSSMLADDIRLPYTFAGLGLFAIAASMSIYSWTSFGSTVGSLGGWMTGASAAACTIMIPMFITRVRRFDRAHDTLIDAAVAQIERDDVAD